MIILHVHSVNRTELWKNIYSTNLMACVLYINVQSIVYARAQPVFITIIIILLHRSLHVIWCGNCDCHTNNLVPPFWYIYTYLTVYLEKKMLLNINLVRNARSGEKNFFSNLKSFPHFLKWIYNVICRTGTNTVYHARVWPLGVASLTSMIQVWLPTSSAAAWNVTTEPDATSSCVTSPPTATVRAKGRCKLKHLTVSRGGE